MKFNKDSFEVGGKVVIPGSFMNSKEAGEIVGTTEVGINVVYNKNKINKQMAFYSYSWLEQEYGDKPLPSALAGDMPDDSLDDLPWDMPRPRTVYP